MKKFAHVLVLIILMAASGSSCQKSKPSIIGEVEVDPPATVYPLASITKVFGFDGQDRYAYCPSIIQEAEKRHIWFCGTEPAGQFIDHIYYIRGDLPYASRITKTALAPGTAGQWDDRHVCDPSVIKGDFGFNGERYSYAMVYLGNRSDRYFNEIGVAFSQTMDAENWVKYPQPLVTKTWMGEKDLAMGAAKAWGVGQPSVISLDGRGEMLLTYTIGDPDGTRVVTREADLFDMGNIKMTAPQRISTAGLSKLDNTSGNIVLLNADFAADADKKNVFMTAHVNPNPVSYPAFISGAVDISSMPYDDFINNRGTWTLRQRIGRRESGFARNHNSGIGRDAFGVVTDPRKGELYFTVSKEAPDVLSVPGNFAEWTYDIYKCADIKLID